MNKTPYYAMEHMPRKPSYEGNIIEHSTLSVVANPEFEESCKKKKKHLKSAFHI